MAHFIPTKFDPGAASLLKAFAFDLPRPVTCSEPLVATTVIESPHGAVIPLVNWSGGVVKGLEVRLVDGSLPTANVSLASGGKVEQLTSSGTKTLRLDLEIADAIILR